MDILEEAQKEAQAAWEEGYKLLTSAASCEVASFCSWWNETYPNHYVTFDDGMGQKSMDIYRKHDNKLMYIACVDGGWTEGAINSPYHYYKNYTPVQEVLVFMEELGVNTNSHEYGYIWADAFKYDPLEEA